MDSTFPVSDERPEGWFRIDHALLEEYGKDMGPYGIAVYTALAHHVNAQRSCWPSYARIAKLTGMSRPTVIATIEKLERLGLIRKEIRKVEGMDEHNTNRYVLVPITAVVPLPRAEVVKDVNHRGKGGLPPQLTTDTTVVNLVNHGGKGRLPEQESLNKNQKQERETPAQPMGDISLIVEPGTPANKRPDAPVLRAVPKFAQTPEFAATLATLLEIWPRRSDGAGPNPRLTEKALVLVDPHDYSAVLAGARRVAGGKDAREGVVKNLHTWLQDADWTRYQVGARPAGGAVYANGKRA